MKALVLGATGFIGGHIARAALGAGWEVRGLGRSANRSGHLGDMPVAWVRGDLNDDASLRLAMERVVVVYHAAAFTGYVIVRWREMYNGKGIDFFRYVFYVERCRR